MRGVSELACAICGQEIAPADDSEEHVLPGVIGGAGLYAVSYTTLVIIGRVIPGMRRSKSSSDRWCSTSA
jgi:hypothetical protein